MFVLQNWLKVLSGAVVMTTSHWAQIKSYFSDLRTQCPRLIIQMSDWTNRIMLPGLVKPRWKSTRFNQTWINLINMNKALSYLDKLLIWCCSLKLLLLLSSFTTRARQWTDRKMWMSELKVFCNKLSCRHVEMLCWSTRTILWYLGF